MGLQFDPGAYFQAHQAGEQQKKSLVDELSSLPQYAVKGMEAGRQNQMNQLLMQMKTEEHQRKFGNPNAQPMQPPTGDWMNLSAQPSSAEPQPMFGGMDKPMGEGEAALPSTVSNWNRLPPGHEFGPRQSAQFGQAQPVPFDQMSFPQKLERYGTEGMDAYTKNQKEQKSGQITPYQQAELGIQKGRMDATAAYRDDLTTNRTANAATGNQDKINKEDRKRWDDVVKNIDPYKASSRSALGIATIGNQRANRAIPVLQNPQATNQDLNTAIADISGIFQGGVPTEAGIHAQEYDTLVGRFNNLKTLITGNPSAPALPQVKQHLLELVSTLKQVNNQTLKDQLDYTETAYPDLIQKNQVAWQGLRKRIGADNPSDTSQNNAQGGGQVHQIGRFKVMVH